jgi:F-type H+-transporting ATPase subunit alpha
LSVSRVGGRAQIPAMKKVGLPLRLELAQYREVAGFAELTTDLDPATMRQLHRGERLAEILKQPQSEPMAVEKQVAVLWCAVNGHLDEVPLDDVARFQKEWFELLDNAFAPTLRRVRESGELDETTEKELGASLEKFKELFVPTGDPVTLSGGRVVPAMDDVEQRLPETAMGLARG